MTKHTEPRTVPPKATLPCPFCGSKKLTIEGSGPSKWIECGECLATGPMTKQAVMEPHVAWDARADV